MSHYMQMGDAPALGEPLVRKEQAEYTSNYCEENVWKLCELISERHPNHLDGCYAVFVSNKDRRVPIWQQRAGQPNENYMVVWDYHVFFIHQNERQSMVYDLDTLLPFPMRFESYFNQALHDNELLQDSRYFRFYRVIEARQYLAMFASDRSHMLRPDGMSYFRPPPPYGCIRSPQADGPHNLDRFISMEPDEDNRFGTVLESNQFKQRFSKFL